MQQLQGSICSCFLEFSLTWTFLYASALLTAFCHELAEIADVSDRCKASVCEAGA
jgi:hypothetical protein